MTILVAAVVSICLISSPTSCEVKNGHVERKACGLAFRLTTAIEPGGPEVAAEARVRCEGPVRPR